MSGLQETAGGHSAPRVPADNMLSNKLLGFAHPGEVLNDGDLSREEKRVLLASWVSDAFSVENSPSLRQLESGAVIYVDDIMEALKSLDEPRREPALKISQSFARRAARPTVKRRNRNPEDDDGSPPPAAGARIPLGWKKLAGAHGNATSALALGHGREITIGGRSAA